MGQIIRGGEERKKILTTGECTKVCEQHPVRGAEEHPSLDVVKCRFGSGKS